MDENLVALAQRGDRAAMADLLRSVAPRSRAVARSLLWSDAVAEDATQQALVAMWRNLPKLRDPSCFDAWSYRIVANACHREARRVGDVAYIDGDEEPLVPAVDDDTKRIVDRDAIERALRRLPLPQREVVALHHLGGLTQEQVAAARAKKAAGEAVEETPANLKAAGRMIPAMPGFAASWAFVLRPLDDGRRTRLVERFRVRMPAPEGPAANVLGNVFGFGVFAMTRKQMLGIRDRAEAALIAAGISAEFATRQGFEAGVEPATAEAGSDEPTPAEPAAAEAATEPSAPDQP